MHRSPIMLYRRSQHLQTLQVKEMAVLAPTRLKVQRTKRSVPTPPHHLVRAVRLEHTESKMSKNEYTLHYHGGIPGRGEFVRLAFEYTGTPYRVRIPSAFTGDLLTYLYPTG